MSNWLLRWGPMIVVAALLLSGAALVLFAARHQYLGTALVLIGVFSLARAVRRARRGNESEPSPATPGSR